MAHKGDARPNIILRVPSRSRQLIVKSFKRRKKSQDHVVEFLEEDDEGLGSDRVHATPDVRVGRAVANVTVGDAGALECGVCFLALRPPIFQCEAGHVVCSACRDKLVSTGNHCHVCRVATRGYRRCHAMERLVDCIRVPCPYSTHGCDATPPYHGRESHSQVCPHAPCHCPGESCGFIGSTAALLENFTGAHDWPCTSKDRAGETLRIRLHVGFNFVLLANKNHAGGDGYQAPTTCSVPCLLFLLNVTQEQLGRAISVLCTHPHTNGVDQPLSTKCELTFSHSGDESLCRSHYQTSEFKVVSTDLSYGLPSPDGFFQFIVPNAVLGDDDKDYIEVKVRISIN